MVADRRLFGLAISTVACLVATTGGVYAQSATPPPVGQQPTVTLTPPPPGGVYAQSATPPPVTQQPPGVVPTTPPFGQQPTVTLTPPAVIAQATSGPQPLFPAIADLGKRIGDNGIYFQLGYTEALLGGIEGGNKKGVATVGELFFGTVLDLQKLLFIPSASFHIVVDERNGYSLSGGPSGFTGSQGPLAAISGPTRTARLSEFYWEQGFFGDRIDVTAGRTNPTFDFDTTSISCTFVSSIICAQPGSWYFSNGSNAYPTSTWGGRVNFSGGLVGLPGAYLRAGVYEDNPNEFLPNNHGFNWDTFGSTGVFVPAELGYETNFSNSRLPTSLKVGGYYDASSFTTPGGQTMHDRTAEWLYVQQTVFRPNPDTNQSLTLFAGGITYNGGAPYWAQAYVGFHDKAPFGAARPLDYISFVTSYYANNQAFSPAHRSQWATELNYAFVVVPGITVQPVVMYVSQPNEIGFPPPIKRPDNAWVLGVQLAFDAGAFFHFPVFHPY